jgi:hypothetical protein
MQGVSPQRIDVLIIGLLPVDKSALPGTVAIVLQGREHDGVVFVRHGWKHIEPLFPQKI